MGHLPTSLLLRAIAAALFGVAAATAGFHKPPIAPSLARRASVISYEVPRINAAPSNNDDPLPIEKSNCVSCHITAGRELTAPVLDFARSSHDRVRMSCNDCHGGNTSDDASAHEHEFGFIGTKLSAHMAACAECHTEEAAAFRQGPHFWDLAKRINRDYPLCIDCHGNHDIGKPPVDFSLANVCSDCHKDLATMFPAVASIIAENDALWRVLRQVHEKNADAADPTPSRFRSELGRIRHATAKVIHGAVPIAPEQAERLNSRVRRLREELEASLKESGVGLLP